MWRNGPVDVSIAAECIEFKRSASSPKAGTDAFSCVLPAESGKGIEARRRGDPGSDWCLALFVNLHRLWRDNIARWLAGEPLRNEVDLSRGY